MKTLLFSIPWRDLASSNERNKRRGGRAHSWSYKRARLKINLDAKHHVPGDCPMLPTEPCALHLDFFPPDARRRDVMNLPKVIMDALQGVVYADDYQVVRVQVMRHGPDRTEPRVDVYVSESFSDFAELMEE